MSSVVVTVVSFVWKLHTDKSLRKFRIGSTVYPRKGDGGGGLPIMDYAGWLRPKGVLFLGFKHVSLVKIYERIGKTIISVLREAQKD